MASYNSKYYYPDILEYYSSDLLLGRLFLPVVATVVVLIATLALNASLPLPDIPRLRQRIWDGLVTITPASVIYAVDDFLNPPLFPIQRPMLPSRAHVAKSEALSRLLGLDKGLMRSMSGMVMGRASFGKAGEGHEDKTIKKPAGLGNFDNSCFQNSILQGLAALHPLPQYLAGPPTNRGHRSDDRVADTLRDLIKSLNDIENGGKTLWTPGPLKNMNTWQQQDAQEYYSKLLEEVDNEMQKAAKSTYAGPGLELDTARFDSSASQHSDDSGYQSTSSASKIFSDARSPRNPLEGLIAQRVTCEQCGYSDGLSMIPFNCLTLSLGTIQQAQNLYGLLDSYTRLEYINGVKCAKCTLMKAESVLSSVIERFRSLGTAEDRLQAPLARLAAIQEALADEDFDDHTLKVKCGIPPENNVSSTKTKQAVIARPPQSLAVHMNRSVFDERSGYMLKNLAVVQFPSVLDLGPWCLGSSPYSPGSQEVDESSSPEKECSDTEGWAIKARESMVAGDVGERCLISGPIYVLRAVVSHFGRHENGHYVCFRTLDTDEDHPSAFAPDSPSKKVELTDGNEPSGSESTMSPGATLSSDNEADGKGTADAPGKIWWRISDDQITAVDEDAVLQQGGAFMLFYDCVDPKPVLVSSLRDGDDLSLDNPPSVVGNGPEPTGQQLPLHPKNPLVSCSEDDSPTSEPPSKSMSTSVNEPPENPSSTNNTLLQANSLLAENIPLPTISDSDLEE